jgi:hypothetical protein
MQTFFDKTMATKWRAYGYSLGAANIMIATALANESKKFKILSVTTFGALSVMDPDGDRYFQLHEIIPNNFIYVDDPVARYTAYLHTMLNARYTAHGPIWMV